MTVKRLYEVARELGLRDRQVAEDLASLGHPARSFASPVSQDELRELYRKYGREQPGAVPADDTTAPPAVP